MGKCPTCNDKNKVLIKCENCKGKGYITYSDGDEEECGFCEEDGYDFAECPDCEALEENNFDVTQE